MPSLISRKYTIGDVIQVNAIAFGEFKFEAPTDRYHKEVCWTSHQLFKPRIGVITGQAIRYDGIYHRRNLEDPAYLEPTKSNMLWLVRFGLRNKEVLVSERDIENYPHALGFELPTLALKVK